MPSSTVASQSFFFSGRKFSLFDNPHNMKLKFEIIQICTIIYICLPELFFYYTVNHNVMISYPTLNTNIEFSKSICYGFKTFHCLMVPKNVNFEFSFPFSLEHNCDKFLSKIKSKDSFEIRIVLAFGKCQKF